MAEEQKAGADGAADAMLAQLDFAATCDAPALTSDRKVCGATASTVMRYACCAHGSVRVICAEHRTTTASRARLGILHRPRGVVPHLAVVKFEPFDGVQS